MSQKNTVRICEFALELKLQLRLLQKPAVRFIPSRGRG